VVALDTAANAVIVGKKEDLFQDELQVDTVNWIAGEEPELPGEFYTKIRYRHAAAMARVTPAGSGRYIVAFQMPQLAVTPGQFAVFSQDNEVLGGGTIL
ncbi:MAG: aminomethyltransferase beta-barrel domain-containing protein, partial [Desulfobulbales bacterium]